LCIGPPTGSGFYYDCVLPDGRPIREEELESVEEFVKVIVNEKQPFERLVLTKEQALKIFAYNKYKVTLTRSPILCVFFLLTSSQVEIISTKVPDGDTLTAYRCGPLIDLCRGPHVPATNLVPAFKILRNSSAYWY
jgi:threonyl-tRNA synthetase